MRNEMEIRERLKNIEKQWEALREAEKEGGDAALVLIQLALRAMIKILKWVLEE